MPLLLIALGIGASLWWLAQDASKAGTALGTAIGHSFFGPTSPPLPVATGQAMALTLLVITPTPLSPADIGTVLTQNGWGPGTISPVSDVRWSATAVRIGPPITLDFSNPPSIAMGPVMIVSAS